MTSVDKRLELAYKSSLVGANLERADLRGLDLRGINLTSANLRGADLSQANLSQATLIRTDLSRANIQRANFTDADMTGCDLTGCYGRGAKFYRTKLCLAYLRYAQFKNAFFIECDMTGADLLNSLFLGAKFDGSNTEGVGGYGRCLEGVRISPFRWKSCGSRGMPTSSLPGSRQSWPRGIGISTSWRTRTWAWRSVPTGFGLPWRRRRQWQTASRSLFRMP